MSSAKKQSSFFATSSKKAILATKEHIPATIAQRMIDYVYKDYQMHIGEHLGDSAKDITFPRPPKP